MAYKKKLLAYCVISYYSPVRAVAKNNRYNSVYNLHLISKENGYLLPPEELSGRLISHAINIVVI